MGSFASGGVAMVGERGRELAFLPDGTRIRSAEDTERMMGPQILFADIYIGGEKIDERVESRIEERRRMDNLQSRARSAVR